MSDSEKAVFDSVRSALKAKGEKTPYPEYDTADLIARPRLESGGLWQSFSKNISAVNGKAMRSIDELVSFLLEKKCRFGHCSLEWDSTIGEAIRAAGMRTSTEFDRERFEDYEFGITSGSGAVAETGTIVLTDAETSDRLAALSPWIHIAVITEDQLVESLGDAIGRFDENNYIVWATGPSKTADVEGILIEGVHGPGEQICLCLPNR
ncbi:MAG: hypothetical protein CMO55_02715 [Verrucomicrobiales bacterium]|nr:hypothetical protein [Verrucomicrobiales bacterium]